LKPQVFITAASDLVAGHVFSYRASMDRLSQRSAGAGQILGFEDGREIVHVRLFDRVPDGLRVFIGHVPIAFSALQRSAARLIAPAETPSDWAESYAVWIERRDRGEVAAFDQSLADVARRAIEAVTESMDAVAPGSVTLRWAFPKRGASGGFNIIEAAIVSPGEPDVLRHRAS
jgi:hypothetical protein